MPVRLGTTRNPAWYDLASGVRIALKPYDAGDEEAGVSAIVATMRATGQNPDGPDVEVAYQVAVAQRTIMAWEAVYPAEGDDPAPVTPENVDALLRHEPEQFRAWKAARNKHIATWGAEGNGSGASPNGTGATGRPTAKDAGPVGLDASTDTATSAPIEA